MKIKRAKKKKETREEEETTQNKLQHVIWLMNAKTAFD